MHVTSVLDKYSFALTKNEPFIHLSGSPQGHPCFNILTTPCYAHVAHCHSTQSELIQINQHSDCRWQKLGNADVWHDSETITTTVCSQISRKWNAMFERHGDHCWRDELRFLIWRCFEQGVFVNNHLLCFWPTIHYSISKICPKVQVISSQLFEVDELLEMSNKLKMCEVKIFQLVRCIDQRFAFKNSCISCLALIFNLSNLTTTILHSKKRLPIAKQVLPIAKQVKSYHLICCFFQ